MNNFKITVFLLSGWLFHLWGPGQLTAQTGPRSPVVTQTIEVQMELNQTARQRSSAYMVTLEAPRQKKTEHSESTETAPPGSGTGTETILEWLELTTADNILLTVVLESPGNRPVTRAVYLNNGNANPALAKAFSGNNATFMVHASGKSRKALNIEPGGMKAWIGLPENENIRVTILYH